MSTTPRLSVIIPARNAIRWLPGAIASVGGRADIEILVVDDGSTDGTADYLRGIARSDRRVRPLVSTGEGAAAARNVGIAAALAPLVAFLDADDRWRRGKIAAQLELHRLHPELAFSFTDHRRFAEDGAALATGLGRCAAFSARHAMRREGFVLDRGAQAQIYAEPLVATSTVMASTALLRAVGGFNEQLRRAEDWDLWLHLAACGPVGCLPKPLADRLVRVMDPDGHEALLRRAARRQVAEAYAAPARLLDEDAPRACRSNLLALDADGAALAGHRVQAALLRLSAFASQPRRDAVRAGAWDLFRPRGHQAALEARGS
ncbi:glycosyltransferase family 2 protein [Falsiroseomonas stagni]|uniref:Glycosyl transferase family 2 n=1 Tax=Falsiroseomonas stagni DSM 19981 TaxID=1123062 RepID=A0A1I3YDG6_9PROT|nr:glycosyltransferase family 2 protein [Falsiroseomonas stagni]SFK29852.1 Glycosyl transferase family 2 [Falsiroseomonas stagni DSM 19981]